MKHRRSPTHSYPQNAAPPVHATLALRHPHPSIPTLLSPLRSISNTPPGIDVALDDFQSNAWLNASSYRPLAGLGITYLCDVPNVHGQPLVLEGFSRQIRATEDEELLFPVDPYGYDTLPYHFPAPTGPYQSVGSEENHTIPRPPNSVFPLCDHNRHLELGFNNDIDPAASNIIGLIPDVNMYDRLRPLDLPHLGINPLDTIRNTSLHGIGISFEDSVPLTHGVSNDEFLPTTDSRAEQSPSSRVIQDIMSILVQPAPEDSLRRCSPANSPSAQSSSLPELALPRLPVPLKFEPMDVSDGEHCSMPAPCTVKLHSSPILNAHLGIELNELISRAERFRTKHPEQDIDRAWLSHFAGKLSDRGELLNDFRCYVIGCDQRNKRRDHILVHVGGHIGQRPFACSVCPLRFLRKNECKRHEASHSGFRPYNCDICGQSFVRQDLVKRHVKRTHGLKDENESSVARQSRKRARLR